MAGITRKQTDVLRFLQKRIFETGESPTYDEIGDALGYRSKSQTARMLQQLVERGAISVIPNRARAITLLGHHRHRKMVPVPAEPPDDEFEAAKITALEAEKHGEDVFWAFWQAMIEPYQRES